MKFTMVHNIDYRPCTRRELADHLRGLAADPKEGRYGVIRNLSDRIDWVPSGDAPSSSHEVQALFQNLEELRTRLKNNISRLALATDDEYLDEVMHIIGMEWEEIRGI